MSLKTPRAAFAVYDSDPAPSSSPSNVSNAAQAHQQGSLLDGLTPTLEPVNSNTSIISREELAARWCLWSVEGIGPKRMEQAIWWTQGHMTRFWQEPKLIARVSARWSLSQARQERLNHLLARPALEQLEEELERLPEHTTLLSWRDDDYPSRLFSLPDPPSFIYIQGQLEAALRRPIVAMIGSRQVSESCSRFAQSLAAELGQLGVGILSGGALGMDAAAHLGALHAGAYTGALLPCGLNHLVPRSHLSLFDKIISAQGGLITEYPAETVARRYHFPRRNRLIAALTDGVIVLRAAATGGSMLTAQAAQSLSRPVGVVPYGADDEGAQGSLALLAKGAFLVRDAQDILSALYDAGDQQQPTSRPSAPATMPTPPLEGVNALIWQELNASSQGLSVQALAQALDLSPSALLVRLTELELEGWIERAASGLGFRASARW